MIRQYNTATEAAILRAVCKAYGITPPEFARKCREWKYVYARKAFAWIAVKHTNATLKAIGEAWGAHHATAHHAKKTAPEMPEIQVQRMRTAEADFCGVSGEIMTWEQQQEVIEKQKAEIDRLNLLLVARGKDLEFLRAAVKNLRERTWGATA